MSERWIPANEAARRLRISEARLVRLVKDGALPRPSYTCGPRSPRYDLEALDAAMSAAKTAMDPDAMVEAYIAKETSKTAH